MIGSAEMQGTLYILRVHSYQNLQIKLVKSSHITNTVNFTVNDLETLWHFLLGHMFQTNLYMLSKINFLLLNITNLLFVIFVILQNKKRLSFPRSVSKSKKYFDLIHVDMW